MFFFGCVCYRSQSGPELFRIPAHFIQFLSTELFLNFLLDSRIKISVSFMCNDCLSFLWRLLSRLRMHRKKPGITHSFSAFFLAGTVMSNEHFINDDLIRLIKESIASLGSGIENRKDKSELEITVLRTL